MKYKVIINNHSGSFCNPLLKLADREFDKREDACEAVYDALYEVIDGDCGCEMVDLPNFDGLSDDEYLAAREKYADECHAYIIKKGCAREDGVSAEVQEIHD